MTETTHARIPAHLRRYIVDQNYSRYTPEDQALWRFILRQLRNFLSSHAHPSYLPGLEKTGISIERIPAISEIDEHLVRLGWGAVPVSGFIPPAAFMEFQSLGILPIASDMRTIDHLLYTPAPDIVHEAAGHAPILCDPTYAAYLKQYGEVARRAIISKEDLDQYEAIRILSDIKEDPRSSRDEIGRAERRLNEVTTGMKGVSEAALLSRMNWWTAEYGLIGDSNKPLLFGAGLLSSVGESRNCLDLSIKKIPLTVDCVDFGYDITEQQPQLFVTRDFNQLGEVLEQLSTRMSYRRGGLYGLECARSALSVNTVQLNSGVQISGVLKDFLINELKEPFYLQLEGPTQLCEQNQELAGQSSVHHPAGFSTPVGLLKGHTQCLSEFSPDGLAKLGIREGEKAALEFMSGVTVSGRVRGWTYSADGSRLLVITWTDCSVKHNERLLFDPAWGAFDMAVGSRVVSVFAGPADRERYGHVEDFTARRVTQRAYDPTERRRFDFYQNLRELRENPKGPAQVLGDFRKLAQAFLNGPPNEWLPGVELLELSYKLGLGDSERKNLRERLSLERFTTPTVQQCVADGVALAESSSNTPSSTLK